MPNHKTGVVSSLDKLTAAHLATLLGEVLSDATYGDNARRIQKAIVKTNGLSLAADLVEQSLETTRMAGGLCSFETLNTAIQTEPAPSR